MNEDIDIVTLVRVRRLNWIGYTNRMNGTTKARKFSAVILRMEGPDEDQDRDGGTVSGQMLRREES